jgi:hypothetical protein
MTVKRSVSVPDDVAAWLDQQDNVSAAVTRAIRAQMAGARTEEILRASGLDITDAGRARWREALSRPIPAEAIADGDEMLRRARLPRND